MFQRREAGSSRIEHMRDQIYSCRKRTFDFGILLKLEEYLGLLKVYIAQMFIATFKQLCYLKVHTVLSWFTFSQVWNEKGKAKHLRSY